MEGLDLVFVGGGIGIVGFGDVEDIVVDVEVIFDYGDE